MALFHGSVAQPLGRPRPETRHVCPVRKRPADAVRRACARFESVGAQPEKAAGSWPKRLIAAALVALFALGSGYVVWRTVIEPVTVAASFMGDALAFVAPENESPAGADEREAFTAAQARLTRSQSPEADIADRGVRSRDAAVAADRAEVARRLSAYEAAQGAR